MKTAKVSMASQILAVLGESPLPVTTPDLIAICACELSHPRQRVWATLQKLERAGLVAKLVETSGRSQTRVAKWRLK